MRKKIAVMCLCFLGGCILVGMVVGIIFQGKLNRQPDSEGELTKEEKEEAIKIALSNVSVKDILKGKEYKVGEVVISRVGSFEERVWQKYPTVKIYLEGKDRIEVIVDLESKKVISVVSVPPYREIMPREVTEEEREEAIKIALDNESVKGKLEGLEYKISHVRASEGRMDKGRMRTPTYDVYVHINGTPICYIVGVDLAEKGVKKISQSFCGNKTWDEKLSATIKTALNDSKVKEEIEEKGYEIYHVSAREKLIGKKLVTDVYIEIKEPRITYVATVDMEEEKVIEMNELTSQWFSKAYETS